MWRRSIWACAGAPLLLSLLGCPQDHASQAGNPSSLPAYSKAPTITPAAQTGDAQPSATGGATQQPTEANDAQHAQQVQALIARAEASYNSGVKNYNSDHLDAAHQDFDYAVDTMLTSGMDLKNDPALSDEFERLLDAINSLELVALKQGNGFSQRMDDAPLESMADMTFPPNPELVAKLRSELNTTSDLPLIINDQVAGYINVFSQSPSFRAHMAASMQRLGRYRTLIQNTLKEEGVPQDLIYLAVAESGFQSQVVNAHSGAGGMWQFMTFTGSEYGLTRNGYFDYRFDPEKSTRAYAKLIKNYYSLFNDWYLAMLAYDWGPGNIQKIVSRTGYSDFWNLYHHASMPAETRAYVPQILAAIIMAKNPEKYGLNKLTPSPAVLYDTVTTDYAVSMNLIADLTGSTPQEIDEFNPALLRSTTPNDIPFDLHVPAGTLQLYQDRIKDIPEDKRASWRFHIVRNGETLDGLAAAFHSHSDEIATLNDVTATKPLEVDDELIIPVAPVASAHVSTQRYRVRKGDTLVSISDRFNISVEQLRSWNHLSSNHASAGQTLYVSEPVHAAMSRSARARRTSTTHSTAARSAKPSAHTASKSPAKTKKKH